MAKTLKEIPTRSASAETKPIGVAMTLDDLDVDVRSQTVADTRCGIASPSITFDRHVSGNRFGADSRPGAGDRTRTP